MGRQFIEREKRRNWFYAAIEGTIQTGLGMSSDP